MKFKSAIKQAFEQEELKETRHIDDLENQILMKIRMEKAEEAELKKYFRPIESFWNFKIPYAFAVAVLAVIFITFTTSSVLAKGSVMEMLISLRNALQQELSQLLNTDPTYRDKGTQKYQQAQKEWCLVSARPAEAREQAVEAVRDFLDRPDANVEYECVRNPSNNTGEQPQTESYIVDFDRFTIDTKTNQIIEMAPTGGRWGENKDGTRWFSPQKEYDYTARYSQAEAEQQARSFIADHEKSLGKIDLSKLTLESGKKDDGSGKVNYFFIWKTDGQGDNIPQLTISYTQGGQFISFLNELPR